MIEFVLELWGCGASEEEDNLHTGKEFHTHTGLQPRVGRTGEGFLGGNLIGLL